MSFNLRILPIEGDTSEFGYSHTVLNLFGVDRVYNALKNISRTKPPMKFNTYVSRNGSEPSYGHHERTVYGDELSCVTTRQFLSAYDRSEQFKYVNSDQEFAVIAYLSQLRSSVRIALDWC